MLQFQSLYPDDETIGWVLFFFAIIISGFLIISIMLGGRREETEEADEADEAK